MALKKDKKNKKKSSLVCKVYMSLFNSKSNLILIFKTTINSLQI